MNNLNEKMNEDKRRLLLPLLVRFIISHSYMERGYILEFYSGHGPSTNSMLE